MVGAYEKRAMMRGRRLDIPSLSGSPYVWAGAATSCFLAFFYLRHLGPRAVYLFLALHILGQIMALISVVWAYRRIGGMGFLLWLAPIMTELLFWPRLLVQAIFGETFGYPSWDEKALIYPILFLSGLYLARRRYANYLQSSSRRDFPKTRPSIG